MDIKTVDLVKEGTLMPCAPDVCQECTVKHNPELPHNQRSLYYQQKGRWPTWEDVLAHCSPQMKDWWKKELRERGIKI